LKRYFLDEDVKISHKRSTKEIIGHRYQIPSPTVLKKLEKFAPLDIWLYDFANRVMDARLEELKTGVFVRPERRALPQMTCKCTSYIISCTDSQIIPKWVSPKATKEYQELFKSSTE
jgi:hypothetical protein